MDENKETTRLPENNSEEIVNNEDDDPERPPMYYRQMDNLRSVKEIWKQFRHIFEFPYFNIIQSHTMNDVLYSDSSVVLSAPTGSGKTVIFELAIIRLLMKFEDNISLDDFKIIYVAPIKALCTERMLDWHKKFSNFLNCAVVTSDTENFDFNYLKNYNLILTTPEKWDSITRKWKDNTKLVESVKLFMIDEVHLLNEETRGSVLEVIVSRMKTIQETMNLERTRRNEEQIQIRYIAVSATIPNIEDITEWLGGKNSQAVYFKIAENLRPVKLKKVVIGYPCAPNMTPFRFDMTLTYKLKSIILEHSIGRPILIFCSTRKGVEMTSNYISENMTFHLSQEQKNILIETSSKIDDNKMRLMIKSGIGCHHAGMSAESRFAIENLFRNGNLPVLVTTSTLSLGVNLPAHLVIIKSTQQYIGGEYKEYSEGSILQMIGRAGRPQYDTTATAVIMTKTTTKAMYERILEGNELIESNLHNHLKEHLNSEIALHTITDFKEALNWLQTTFLYIRAMKNPKHYKIPQNYTQAKIEQKFLEMCQTEMNDLSKHGLIEHSDDWLEVKPTLIGILMARYYLNFESIKIFLDIKGDENLSDMLTIISRCSEFSDSFLRVNEKSSLNMLNRCKNSETIRFPLKGKIKSVPMKVNCMIQAVFGNLKFSHSSLLQESGRIMNIGVRLSRFLVEFLERKEKVFSALLNAIILSKCFQAKLWEDSKHLCMQLHGIGPVLSNTLVTNGKTSFKSILNTDPRALEMILNRRAPFGNELKEHVEHLPFYSLNVTLLERNEYTKVEVQVILNNPSKIKEKCTIPPKNFMYLIVGDSQNNILLYHKLFHYQMATSVMMNYNIEIRSNFDGNIKAHLISDNWVGIDCEDSIYVYKYQEDIPNNFVERNISSSNKRKTSSEKSRKTSQQNADIRSYMKPISPKENISNADEIINNSFDDDDVTNSNQNDDVIKGLLEKYCQDQEREETQENNRADNQEKFYSSELDEMFGDNNEAKMIFDQIYNNAIKAQMNNKMDVENVNQVGLKIAFLAVASQIPEYNLNIFDNIENLFCSPQVQKENNEVEQDEKEDDEVGNYVNLNNLDVKSKIPDLSIIDNYENVFCTPQVENQYVQAQMVQEDKIETNRTIPSTIPDYNLNISHENVFYTPLVSKVEQKGSNVEPQKYFGYVENLFCTPKFQELVCSKDQEFEALNNFEMDSKKSYIPEIDQKEYNTINNSSLSECQLRNDLENKESQEYEIQRNIKEDESPNKSQISFSTLETKHRVNPGVYYTPQIGKKTFELNSKMNNSFGFESPKNFVTEKICFKNYSEYLSMCERKCNETNLSQRSNTVKENPFLTVDVSEVAQNNATVQEFNDSNCNDKNEGNKTEYNSEEGKENCDELNDSRTHGIVGLNIYKDDSKIILEEESELMKDNYKLFLTDSKLHSNECFEKSPKTALENNSKLIIDSDSKWRSVEYSQLDEDSKLRLSEYGELNLSSDSEEHIKSYLTEKSKTRMGFPEKLNVYKPKENYINTSKLPSYRMKKAVSKSIGINQNKMSTTSNKINSPITDPEEIRLDKTKNHQDDIKISSNINISYNKIHISSNEVNVSSDSLNRISPLEKDEDKFLRYLSPEECEAYFKKKFSQRYRKINENVFSNSFDNTLHQTKDSFEVANGLCNISGESKKEMTIDESLNVNNGFGIINFEGGVKKMKSSTLKEYLQPKENILEASTFHPDETFRDKIFGMRNKSPGVLSVQKRSFMDDSYFDEQNNRFEIQKLKSNPNYGQNPLIPYENLNSKFKSMQTHDKFRYKSTPSRDDYEPQHNFMPKLEGSKSMPIRKDFGTFGTMPTNENYGSVSNRQSFGDQSVSIPHDFGYHSISTPQDYRSQHSHQKYGSEYKSMPTFGEFTNQYKSVPTRKDYGYQSVSTYQDYGSQKLPSRDDYETQHLMSQYGLRDRHEFESLSNGPVKLPPNSPPTPTSSLPNPFKNVSKMTNRRDADEEYRSREQKIDWGEFLRRNNRFGTSRINESQNYHSNYEFKRRLDQLKSDQHTSKLIDQFQDPRRSSQNESFGFKNETNQNHQRFLNVSNNFGIEKENINPINFPQNQCPQRNIKNDENFRFASQNFGSQNNLFQGGSNFGNNYDVRRSYPCSLNQKSDLDLPKPQNFKYDYHRHNPYEDIDNTFLVHKNKKLKTDNVPNRHPYFQNSTGFQNNFNFSPNSPNRFLDSSVDFGNDFEKNSSNSSTSSSFESYQKFVENEEVVIEYFKDKNRRKYEEDEYYKNYRQHHHNYQPQNQNYPHQNHNYPHYNYQQQGQFQPGNYQEQLPHLVLQSKPLTFSKKEPRRCDEMQGPPEKSNLPSTLDILKQFEFHKRKKMSIKNFDKKYEEKNSYDHQKDVPKYSIVEIKSKK